MKFLNLHRISFHDALERQEELLQSIWKGQSQETVLIVEHPPVFTVGRGGSPSNLLAERDFEGRPVDLVRINRGGDVTFHGPGQLVAYPLLDLRRRGRDVHRYLRNLEEVLIRLAQLYDIEAFRRKQLTGVWTEQGKLASIGVGVRHWVTMHGLALNVCPDLRYFSLINPCGIQNCPVTSLSQLCGREISLEDVIPRFESCFKGVFV